MKLLQIFILFYLSSPSIIAQDYILKIVSPEAKIIAYKISIGNISFRSDTAGVVKLTNKFVSKNGLKMIMLKFENSSDNLFYSNKDFCTSVEADTLDKKNNLGLNNLILLEAKDCNISFDRMTLKEVFKTKSVKLYFHNNQHTNTSTNVSKTRPA